LPDGSIVIAYCIAKERIMTVRCIAAANGVVTKRVKSSGCVAVASCVEDKGSNTVCSVLAPGRVV
jgi:hypothetical protein